MPELPSFARGPMDWPGSPAGARGEAAAGAGPRGSRAAAETRQERERQLERAHHDVLDFDPDHHLIVRGEVVALAAAPAAIAGAEAKGFTIRRQGLLDGLDVVATVLEPPHRMALQRALQELRAADPGGAYDYNHVYLESAVTDASDGAVPGGQRNGTPAAPGGTLHARRVGLIDSGVDSAHPALASVAVHTHGCNGASVPAQHGTEVASLLLGAGDGSFRAPPGSELYAADVYCGAPTGGAVDALIDALAWLLRAGVPVINVSLVGPPNALLGRVIQLAAQRGHLIVAPVGNDGPAAAPLYPAAYPEVVAVTGVDRSWKVLLEASRGTHVDFAAPGADIFAASLPDGRAQVRGTSFAAPIVAGLLAERLDHPDPLMAQQAKQALAASAVHLGARGNDPVYGNGLVGSDMLTRSAAVAQSR